MADIKSMEHATLKVPYEILNKKFRIAQKTLDREVNQIQNAASEMEKSLCAGVSCSEIQKIFDGVVERLQVFKRKAEENINEEISATHICKRKLNHLKENISTDLKSSYEVWQASLDQWKKIRMDRMVVEHLLRQGHYKTAELLAARTTIRHLTNLDIFQTSREVEEDLANHKTSKCTLWCNDNKSKLRKINSKIEFQLRVQEFIELVREDKRKDAVKHARKYFPSFEKDHLKEICQVMAILAFQSDTQLEPYKSLFDPVRWDNLVLSFRNENYRLYQLSSQSLLSVTLQTGLSALKTPQCYSTGSKNYNCPVCQTDFNIIANNLPYSHCAQSRLICRVTGLPLNEHNLPMMLPNGQIFGQLAIPQITKEDGIVVCPITKQVWCDPKIEKVFVM
ncbi:E3 ubiquitin-protein transferase MAEA [Condylostylus longicornis]|uniref:E3 ubiquitin-protein transferase MAEA n=1 Tax=Condylostylus longicornis TaxID=2530218 RepID=UPI00244DE0E6|nr:E3 ubiquitin-protein transferase MAEA [Condylostylus longicornis]